MDGLVALALIAIAAFFLGPIAFFMTIGKGPRLAQAEYQLRALNDQLRVLKERIAELERRAPVSAPPFPAPAARETARPEPLSQASAPAPFEPPPLQASLPVDTLLQPGEAAPPPLPEPVLPPEAPPPPPEAIPLAASTAVNASAAAPAPTRSLEESLGAHWTVWVGGVALALGALLLVRYSIEQGFFGPGARVLLGLALAAALVGAGEWLRRREGAAIKVGGFESAYVPGVLTAVGTIAAFGDIYAAYALYGFIGPATAFLALGATGLAAMAAAALHGPALAGLGLVGALIAPLLVASERPDPWPAVLYLAIVVAAACWLAWMRRWLWLALCGVAGGAAWSLLLREAAGEPALADSYHAAAVCFVAQAALAAFFVGFQPNRGGSDEAVQLDRIGNAALAAITIVGALVFSLQYPTVFFDSYWIVGAAATVALLTTTGILAPPVAGASALAGAFVLAATMLWPAADDVPLHGRVSSLDAMLWRAPEAPTPYLLFSTILALGAGAAAGKRLLGGANLTFAPAALYAGAVALTPLGALIIADQRFSAGVANWPMAAAAALLAALFTAAATAFSVGSGESPSPALRLGLGAMAASAIAALAAGLVFALDGGALTVSLALAALGAAFVATRLDIPALRWCVAGLGVAVGARLAWEPRIIGAALSPTPIFNWLLFGYGAPAAAFGLSARLLRRRGEDTPVRVADALAILFSAFLVFFEIRHMMNGGDPYARGSGLAEQALMTLSSLGFALVLTRLDAGRANIVFRIASLAAGAIGMALGAVSLLLRYNPYLDGIPVEGGLIVNALILAYLLPALLAGALAVFARSRRPTWYWGGAGALATLFAAAYLLLQLRLFFHGASIGFDEGFTLSELGLDTSLCLALAIGLDVAPTTRRFANGTATNALFGASVGIGVAGLCGFENPLFTNEPIAGGVALNALLVAYALPALLTMILARRVRRTPIGALAGAASLAAILWLFAYVSLETRRAFEGAAIGLDRWPGDGEWYAYSAVWLALGLALLAYGVWRGSREARYASAFFVIATTLKVFLFDLAGLEGVLRALSFMGLGAALIGVGLVYQKLVFARTAPTSGKPA